MRERSIFGLFKRVSLEFAGTCCAHCAACFSTAVPLREEEGDVGLGHQNVFFSSFVNGGLVCARLLSCC